MRVRIFIDFWNFQLSWNEFHRRQGREGRIRIPWTPTLPDLICRRLDAEALHSGTRVYASIDETRSTDANLKKFLHAMDGFPGYKVIVKERKPASRIHCRHCDSYIDDCPHCSRKLVRMVEKGVDTSLATDLITTTLDATHDRAVLVTGDADFVPAVEYLQERGHRITHAFFKPIGEELRNACWDHFDLATLIPALCPDLDTSPGSAN